MLGIDDFFYVSDKSYDDLAERAIPHYHEAHRLLMASLDFPSDAPISVVDLGVGTGVTSAYILKNFPHAKVTGVDLFDEMLCEARERLSPFSGRVNLVRSDNAEYLRGLDRRVDAIVSAFCIHHQNEEGKKSLFSLIRDQLRPGGQFVMLDWTTYFHPHLRAISREHSLANMQSRVLDPQDQKKWTYHWNTVNKPSVHEDLIAWLNGTGLRAETFCRWPELSLIVAFAEKEDS